MRFTRRGLFGALFLAPFVRKVQPSGPSAAVMEAAAVARQLTRLEYQLRAREIQRLIDKAERINREAIASLTQVLARVPS